MTSGNRPPELQAVFDLLERGEPFASIEDAQRAMDAQMRGYNSRPQADLGGLSPSQMYDLLYGDWKSTGALRLNEHLTLDDLSGAAILADARTLIAYIRDEGPVKETAARYLPPAAVVALLPGLRMLLEPGISRNHTFKTPSREAEVPWLLELREIMTFGKLLVRRKGVRITTLGRALLPVERAGELYAHVFRTFFRSFNLSVLDGASLNAGLQGTLAYSLHMLRSTAREWKSPKELAQSSWLESAKDPLDAWERTSGDHRYIPFKCRVLDPLVQFGLLEIRPHKRDGAMRWESDYRCSPLYARFLRFEFRGA